MAIKYNIPISLSTTNPLYYCSTNTPSDNSSFHPQSETSIF